MKEESTGWQEVRIKNEDSWHWRCTQTLICFMYFWMNWYHLYCHQPDERHKCVLETALCVHSVEGITILAFQHLSERERL